MATDDDLIDYLLQAEEWHQQGRPFQIAELSPDRPDCWPRLEELLRGLRLLDQQLHVAETSHPGAGPAAPTPAPLPRDAFARKGYEILGEVGRGGMGVVYRARQATLKRTVALKMILASSHASPQQLARFRREAELLARLRHPNIVQIHEVGEQDGQPFFCMEYLEGGNLAGQIAGRPQPPRGAAELVETLARAVHTAHEQGVVHRDLKPANILLDAAGVPRITDFGLAKDVHEETGYSGSQIVGTPSHLAPEQVRRDGAAVGPAADIYALGILLYELLTGRVPHKGENSMETVLLVLQQEPVPPSRLQPRLPADLDTITLKCLNKQPAKRYATALELAGDLRRWLRHEPIRARPVGPLERLGRWCQRRPALAAMSAALVLVSLLGLAGVIWQLLSAEAAREVAVQEKESADVERGRALRLAEDLRRQRDAAEWQTYRANIGAAMSAVQLQNYDSARRYLAPAPEKHRNWEWAYLSNLLKPLHTGIRGHEDRVLDMAFSPDGRRIASASADRTVRLSEVATGRAIAVLRGHEKGVWSVDFSPDGRRLASRDGAEVVRLWDPSTGALVAALSGTSWGHFPVFSPDSRYVAFGGAERAVYVWDASTGELRHTWRHRSGISCPVAFAADGARLFGASADGTITAWELGSGRVTKSWQAHSNGIAALSLSPDGQCLASGGDFPENAGRLWDAASGRQLATLSGHKNRVNRLVFSRDGSRLVSACWDQTARLWDRATGRALAVLAHRGRVTDAAFSPDGERLVTRGEDQALRLWDARTGEPLVVLNVGAKISERGTAFSPDGKLLACPSENRQVLVWEAALFERNGVLRGHTGYVYDVAISPDGTRIASAAWDGTVRIWDAATQRPIQVLRHEERIVLSVAFSPDGKRVVSVGRGREYVSRGTVSVWEWAAGRRRYTRSTSRDIQGDTRTAFHPDGSLVAVGGQGAAELFDPASDRAGRAFGAVEGSSNDIAFRRDGREMATAQRDATVRFWDLATGAQRGVLHGHQGEVFCLQYSPDGKQIASAGRDLTVRLWDARTHEQLAALPLGRIAYGLAFSPNGTRLATACEDNTIRLWDLASREEVAELHGHTDYVHAVAFSPDGTKLVSCSGDHTVRIWDSLPARQRTAPAHEQIRDTPVPRPGR